MISRNLSLASTSAIRSLVCPAPCKAEGCPGSVICSTCAIYALSFASKAVILSSSCPCITYDRRSHGFRDLQRRGTHRIHDHVRCVNQADPTNRLFASSNAIVELNEQTAQLNGLQYLITNHIASEAAKMA